MRSVSKAFTEKVTHWFDVDVFAKLILLSYVLLFSSSFALCQTVQQHPEPGWLAFGEARGYFEPCGCDPVADLGGVDRLSALLERERAISPDILVLNLGNNLSPQWQHDSIKGKFILEALAAMKVDAYLVNELEWASKIIENATVPKHPWILSNLKQPQKYSNVVTSIQKTNVTVFGYLESAIRYKELEARPEKLVPNWRSEWKKKSDSLATKGKKILLFSGSDKRLMEFLRLEFFDEIISASTVPMSKVLGPEEKNDEKLLGRLHSKVAMVPVGAQGVLRGGSLLKTRAPLLKDILGSSMQQQGCQSQATLRGESSVTSCAEPSAAPLAVGGSPYTWLTKDYAGLSSSISSVLSAYQNSMQQQFQSLASEKKAARQNISSRYVGSESCKGCHASSFQVWQASRHAHAYATLQNVKKNEDSNCVGCHVVGFDEKDGFIDYSHTPSLANVQCENCHGPGVSHIQDPRGAKMLVSAKASLQDKTKLCTSCHHGTHTANFDYNLFWPKISHGK